MGKSIIDDGAERCFLCGLYTALETHHIFHGTANRKKADKDGMIIHVCSKCHRLIHQDTKSRLDEEIKEWAEGEWLSYYGKTEEDFRARYGKSYKEDDYGSC
jgi:Zn-finger protein